MTPVNPARMSFGALKSTPPVERQSDHSRPLESAEFARMEGLTSKLLQVPKCEVDEKREKRD